MQKLLVLDENSTIQRVIKLAFKDEAIRVATVPRGRDVFEQIEADPPDIILADNGREVAAFLKSRPKLSHIPVVLLKGAFDAASEGPDEALGCDDVLMKPLQPQPMIDRVKRLLRDGKPTRAKPPSRVPAPAPAVSPAIKSSSVDNVPRIDPALELGQYFDRLSVAFSRAESAPATSLPDAGWLYPPRPNGEGPQAMVPKAAEKQSPPAVSDELVELVTQRVLDRLGDRFVRSTATELVARLSKWLIVDEVERAKAGK